MRGDNLGKKTAGLRRPIGLRVALVWLAPFTITAQVDQRFAQAQQENALALKKYEWKSRTEIQKDGDTKNVQLALMRYDINGNVQKTPISSTQEDLPTRGLRGTYRPKEEERVHGQSGGPGRTGQVVQRTAARHNEGFMATSILTPEVTSQQKLVRIEGRGVLQSR